MTDKDNSHDCDFKKRRPCFVTSNATSLFMNDKVALLEYNRKRRVACLDTANVPVMFVPIYDTFIGSDRQRLLAIL